MRAVADTNIVVSGMLWHGLPQQILDAARFNQIYLFTTDELINELSNTFGRQKFASRMARAGATTAQLIETYRNMATIIFAPAIPRTSIDPDDDAVLACAAAARVDAIISVDRHLLQLGHYSNIPIQTASEFLRRLAP
jgi:putative PIN family toxin of toxin-antitoxin system